jgi:tetratricopeptide (TPR) repeat protein
MDRRLALVGVVALAAATAPRAAVAEEAPAVAAEGVPAAESSSGDDVADEARVHFEQGVALVADGEFEAALAEFRISYRLRRLPGVLYNIGVVERRLNRYGEAVDTFRSYLADAEERGEPAARIDEVRSIVSELEPLLASVSVQTSEAEAHVFVDGEFVGRTPLGADLRIQAGSHDIEVRLEGFQTYRETIEVHGEEHRRLVVELSPARRRPWYEQWWVWTTVGVVLAGAAVAVALPLTLTPEEADFGPVEVVIP